MVGSSCYSEYEPRFRAASSVQGAGQFRHGGEGGYNLPKPWVPNPLKAHFRLACITHLDFGILHFLVF